MRVGNRQRVLGIDFFCGTAEQATDELASRGGLLLAPASPALVKLNYDETYRAALLSADIVVADSELLTILARMRIGGDVKRISGIACLRALFVHLAKHPDESCAMVVGSEEARSLALRWSDENGVTAQVFVRADTTRDHELLLELESAKPRHIVLGFTSGEQPTFGAYLREYLLYRPCIYAVGAAVGMVTGDERQIPDSLERHGLGWASRLAAQPSMIVPRGLTAATVAAMILRYGSELPPLRRRWTDV